MPSARRQKPKARKAPPKPPSGRSRPAKKAAKPAAKPAARPPSSPPRAAKIPAEKAPVKTRAVLAVEIAEVRRPDGRTHVLSLSFVRDGDEFLARLETDAGQITELKNRSLDQLLTLVAGELEDLLE